MSRVVSMIKLTNAHQKINKRAIDFIDRWRNLNLNCKDHFNKIFEIEICIQGVHWDLPYIL